MIKLKVSLSEIFTSVEGEGIYFGTKTMFVRLAGCHLKCFWCDTPYALSMNDGKDYEVSDVTKMIDDNLIQSLFQIQWRQPPGFLPPPL